MCVKCYIKKTAFFQLKLLFCFAIFIKTLGTSWSSSQLALYFCFSFCGYMCPLSLMVSGHLFLHAFTLSDLGLLCMLWGFFTLKVETKGGGRHVQHVMETQTLFRVKEMDQQREGWTKRKRGVAWSREPSERSTTKQHHVNVVFSSFLQTSSFFVSPVSCCFSVFNAPSVCFSSSFLFLSFSSYIVTHMYFSPLLPLFSSSAGLLKLTLSNLSRPVFLSFGMKTYMSWSCQHSKVTFFHISKWELNKIHSSSESLACNQCREGYF